MTTKQLAESQTEVESTGVPGIEESQAPGEFDAFMSGTEEGAPVVEQVEEKPVTPIPSVEELMGRVKQLESGMSAQDQHLNQARQLLARQALDREIAEAEAIEGQFQAQDRVAVDNGEMTARDAAQRSRQRQEQARQEQDRKRSVQQQVRELAALRGRMEMDAKPVVAADIAKKYGIDAEALLVDPSITNWQTMEFKARELALEKREAALKGRDTFDSGQTGVTRHSVDEMSPMEKITYGLAHPPRKR